MNFEDERYVRAMTRDTTNYLMLSWNAQTLLWMILRKVDRTGVLDLGAHGLKGIMAHLPKLPGERWAEYETALHELIDDGTFIYRENCLIMVNFLEAQECQYSNGARQRAWREKQRDLARHGHLLDPKNTPSDGPVTTTNAPASGGNGTPVNGHDLSSAGHKALLDRNAALRDRNGTPSGGNGTPSGGHSVPSVPSVPPPQNARAGDRGWVGEGEPEKQADPEAALSDAERVMQAWNAMPSRVGPPLVSAATAKPIAVALADLRSAVGALEPVPPDEALLTALHSVAQGKAQGGLHSAWRPSVMAGFVGEALLVARGEVKVPSVNGRSRHRSHQLVDLPPPPPPRSAEEQAEVDRTIRAMKGLAEDES